MTYNQLNIRHKFIVNKWREFVLMNGYIENLGADDERKYGEAVDASDLTYQEKQQLKTKLRVAIEAI